MYIKYLNVKVMMVILISSFFSISCSSNKSVVVKRSKNNYEQRDLIPIRLVDPKGITEESKSYSVKVERSIFADMVFEILSDIILPECSHLPYSFEKRDCCNN